tara:strand:- start:187 stop:1281 length:1095 start_codon:yes stop_codon:yes gene_type:complete
MEKKTISFCADGDQSLGSYRIPFVWIKEILLSKNFNCVDNIIDSYVDFYFCKGGQNIATKIKKTNKNAIIFLFKPHYEIGLDLNLRYPFKFVYRIIALIYECIFKEKQKKFLSDIYSSEILIADTKKLALFYKTKYDKKVLYLRLLEKIDINTKYDISKKIEKEIIILFHGGIQHYNENFPQLKALLETASRYKFVRFICVSNIEKIQKKISLKNVKSEYYPYDFDTLIKFLKIAHLGYVPNFLRSRIPFLKTIYNYINFKFYQLHLYNITEKNSSNAGRAYLYAVFGIPFLAHPTREIIADFSSIEELEFPNDTEESNYFLKKLISNNDLYSSISNKLLILSNEYSLEKEVEKIIKLLYVYKV